MALLRSELTVFELNLAVTSYLFIRNIETG